MAAMAQPKQIMALEAVVVLLLLAGLRQAQDRGVVAVLVQHQVFLVAVSLMLAVVRELHTIVKAALEVQVAVVMVAAAVVNLQQQQLPQEPQIVEVVAVVLRSMMPLVLLV
jgi:hypothetical protein